MFRTDTSSKVLRWASCIIGLGLLSAGLYLALTALSPIPAKAAPQNDIQVSMSYQQQKPEGDFAGGDTWIADSERDINLTASPVNPSSTIISNINVDSTANNCPARLSEGGKAGTKVVKLRFSGEGDGRQFDLSSCNVTIDYESSGTPQSRSLSLSSITFTAMDRNGTVLNSFPGTLQHVIVDKSSDRSAHLWVTGDPSTDPLGDSFKKVTMVSLASRDPWFSAIMNVAKARYEQNNPNMPFSPFAEFQQEPQHERKGQLKCPSFPGKYTSASPSPAGTGSVGGNWQVLDHGCSVTFPDIPHESNARYTATLQPELATFLGPKPPAAATSLSFVYDTENPVITKIEYMREQQDGEEDNEIFAEGQRKVRIYVKDKMPLAPKVDQNGIMINHPEQNGSTEQSDSSASGFGTLKLTGNLYTSYDGSANPNGGRALTGCDVGQSSFDGIPCDYSYTIKTDDPGTGSFFEVTLKGVGGYDFNGIWAIVTDRAGNSGKSVLLNNGTNTNINILWINDLDVSAGGTQILVSEPGHRPEPVPTPPSGSGQDTHFYKSGVELTIQSRDFQLLRHLVKSAGKRNTPALKYQYNNGQGWTDACTVDAAYLKGNLQRFPQHWILSCGSNGIPKDSNGVQINGVYSFKLRLKGTGTALTKFGIDTERPVVSDYKGLTGANINTIHYLMNKKNWTILTSPGSNTIQVRVQDLLPPAQQNDDADTSLASQSGTSGLAQYGQGVSGSSGTVRVDIPAPTDMSGAPIGASQNLHSSVDEKGWVEIALKDEGLYDLSKMTITAVDNAQNETKKNLADIIREVGNRPPSEANTDNYAIVIAGSGSKRSVSIKVANQKGNPDSTDREKYFRGEALVDFTVTDRWFPLYRQLNDPFLTGDVTPHSQIPFEPVLLNSDGWKSTGDSDTWVYSGYRLPRSLSNRNLPHEGDYTLAVQYSGLQNDKITSARSFTVDYTGPQLGSLRLSARSPEHWNWIFPTTPLHVSLDGIDDSISGVDASTLAFKEYDGEADKPMLNYDPWLTPSDAANPTSSLQQNGGVASFDLGGDSQRLRFDGTSIAIKDKAGNPASTHALSTYAQPASNDAYGLTGAAVDMVTPRMTVVFDNNDVRNGKYYKAHRTATITIDETNFDFVIANDGRRNIVTAAVDGRKTELRAGDFSNPSGDRHTYVATMNHATDGDWVVDAHFTDPGDHQPVSYHAEFTIDTVKPVLTLNFDNTSSRNGMYYKAPRTATVKLVERNFDSAQSTIRTSAKNATGQAGQAPAGGGWSTSGAADKYTHLQLVHFGGEYHYTLEADATDLAGNTAQVVKEPEFVIDMTKPDLHIDKVEDRTAYAGTVAPEIKFKDDNIDQDAATYQVEGDRRGKVKPKDLKPSEKTGKDTKDIQISDFKRKVDVDDVYTVTAKGEDKAGNVATVTKTFSVNRFGSTYIFSSGTASLRGTYLKQAQPVRVTELNVSGIETGHSRISIAKDSSVRQLSSAEYGELLETEKGWSKTTYSIPPEKFDGDGYYRVLFTSTDRAGNLSENTMNKKDEDRKRDAALNFAIDSQAPTASVLGIESNRFYYGQSHRIAIDAKDNMKLHSAQVFVDDRSRGKWSDADLLKHTPSLDIPADGQPHKVVVETRDAAGNAATVTYNGVVVASDWMQYLRGNGFLVVFFSVAAFLILIMVAAGMVVFIRRRRRFTGLYEPVGRHGRSGSAW